MGAELILVVLIGALAGGFVNGLAGFGTGLTALGIWLWVLEPAAAATLVVVCSVVAQAQTLPAIWRQVEARRVLPFILPGLAGVPLGTLLLGHIDARVLKIGVGGVLVLFSVTMLLQASARGTAWGGRIADGTVGFTGGILGALAGLSGVLPTMWAAVRGWPKGESRSVFQTFNLSVLGAALLAHWAAGFLTQAIAWTVLAALPGTITGAWLGAMAYRRLSDRRFRELILALLGISGVLLIWSNT